MAETALILGANGHFGHATVAAFAAAGWEVRRFRRGADDLATAARGAAVIVNGWNPGYTRWASELLPQTDALIEAARGAGATIVQPLNLYVYGRDLPVVLGPETPHRADNPLGLLRIEMEARLRAAGVPAILVRAGDFFGPVPPGGGWIDGVIARKVTAGRISYPGPLELPHAWAYLPDLARAAVMLADRRADLPAVTEVLFPGDTLTGTALAAGYAEALGRPVAARTMSWLPLQLAAAVWPMGRRLLEMRYLWDRPHRVDGAAFAALLPEFRPTPLAEALRASVPA